VSLRPSWSTRSGVIVKDGNLEGLGLADAVERAGLLYEEVYYTVSIRVKTRDPVN
jgi:hypothetical protein